MRIFTVPSPRPLVALDETPWPCGYRIVIIAPFPPPLGGMAVQAEQLLRLLETKDVSVTAISTTQKIQGILRFLEIFPGIRTLLHLFIFLRKVYTLASVKTIFHIFSNSFASFFLWTGSSILICKWRKASVVINYRGGHASKFLQTLKRFALPVFRQADRVIVPSRFLQSVFLQNGISTQVIPNIIDDALQPRRSLGNKAPHIIVNRNFEAIYNVACAIRAFAIIQDSYPKAKLTLIGDGSQRTQLERLISTLGLRNITFTGQLANQKVIKLLHNADLLLNPTNVDNMPISLLEAMAIGVPIVSTNAGGIPFLISNKASGLLVNKDNHQAMARAGLRVLRSVRLQKRLKSNALEQVEKCRWRNVWPLWRSIYLSIIKH